MAKGSEIPKTDSAEIEILITRLKENKLEQRDVELIERLLRTVLSWSISCSGRIFRSNGCER
jgi:hypothetical protein